MFRKLLLIVSFVIVGIAFSSCESILGSILDSINDDEPPEVIIISPVNGSNISIDSSTISIIVYARDNRELIGVEFYIDSIRKNIMYGWDNDYKYLDSLNCFRHILETNGYDESSIHQIYIRAYDKSNNITVTSPVYFTLIGNHSIEIISDVYNITNSTAMIKVIAQNNCISHPILAKGICWGNKINPDLNDYYTDERGGPGSFISTITQLIADQSYHVRPYLYSDIDTLYGNDLKFLTPSTLISEYSMIFMEGDSFSMGDIWGDGQENERPVHNVTLNSYYIGKYELTQDIYIETVGKNPSIYLGYRTPVHNISWLEAIEFCNAYSIKNGYDPVYSINSPTVVFDFSKNGYRLPTEAEWEFAARSGGRKDRKWSGTNEGIQVENYGYVSNTLGEKIVHNVGERRSNDLKIEDMTGNVFELCWGVLNDYTSSPKTNPHELSLMTDDEHVAKGGYFSSPNRGCRNSSRYTDSLLYDWRSSPPLCSYIGLRLVRKAE